MTSPHSRFRIAPEIHAREFAGELVILDVARGRYFSLDDIGTRIWRGIERGETPRAIADHLVTEYAAEPDRILADLLRLADDLLERGLIVIATPNASASDAST